MYVSNIFKRSNKFISAWHGRISGSICSEKEFRRIMDRERARADRSGQRFSLVVFDVGSSQVNGALCKHLLTQLKDRLRATDEIGWIDERCNVGALLHDATTESAWSFASTIKKVLAERGLPLTCNVYTYPLSRLNRQNDGEKNTGQREAVTRFAEKGDERQMMETQRIITPRMPMWKRNMDIAGSFVGLLLLSPLMLLISFAIKSVSPGSVFFKQKRLGLAGRTFTFWKFRTMKLNAGISDHQQYLAELIKGACEGRNARPMAKLDDNNPNIIPFGRILRKTCLDELPQLINVLRGEMSLIGPRPPIPYEVEEYQQWHKGRLAAVPGMTGLWQVSGKNRLAFDEMVRLDIRYVRQRSFWLDLKILLMTPIAIALEISDSR